MNVAVVGGGTIGLHCALALLQRKARVTVIAESHTPNTVSDNAGAIWIPYHAGATPDELISRWSRATLARYVELVHSAGPGARVNKTMGVSLCRGTYELADPVRPPWATTLTEHGLQFGVATAAERRSSGPVAAAWRFEAPVVDPPVYLRHLHTRIRDLGGRIETRRVDSLASLASAGSEFDVVVNCTGLGARELAGDEGVTPTRGQVIKVTEFSVLAADDTELTYLIPRAGSGVVVCGGTHQACDYDTSVRTADHQGIWSRCQRAERKLRGVKLGDVLVNAWAGGRPFREQGVRLERDSTGTYEAPVVHCYGHGGSGHTLAWGCALDVADLVLASPVKPRASLRSNVASLTAGAGATRCPSATAAAAEPQAQCQRSGATLSPVASECTCARARERALVQASSSRSDAQAQAGLVPTSDQVRTASAAHVACGPVRMCVCPRHDQAPPVSIVPSRPAGSDVSTCTGTPDLAYACEGECDRECTSASARRGAPRAGLWQLSKL